MEDTVIVDLIDDGMYHDTLYVRGITGFTYQTPPQLGNSTLLYFGTDSNGFQNPFALFRVSSTSQTGEALDSYIDTTTEIDSVKFVLTFNEDSITTGMLFDLFYFQEGGDSIFSESESNYLNLTKNDLNHGVFVSSSRLSQREPDSLETANFPTLSFNVAEILDSFSDTSSENRNLTVMIKPKFELAGVFSFKSSEGGFAYAPQMQVFTHDTAFVDSTGDSVVVDTISHTFISTNDLSIIIPPNLIYENPNNIYLGRGMTYKVVVQIPGLDSILLPHQATITKAELSLFYVNDSSQSNFYLQIQPILDSVSIVDLQGLLLDDPLTIEPSLIAVNLSGNGKITLNIREYLQLYHFGYIQNQGLKMELTNTVNPFNTYSFYADNSDSLAPKLIIHYVAP